MAEDKVNVMNPKEWQLPVRRLPTFVKVDRTVLWNNTKPCYEQDLFGQVARIEYNHRGTKLGCVSSNHSLMLRVPHSGGAVWNDQSARQLHSVRFRADDKMVAICSEKRVLARSVETAFERQLVGHTQAARDAIFISPQTIASCSDDATVRVWDVITEKEVDVGKGHTDYVRSLAAFGDTTFFSGSYDRSVRLWDLRQSLECCGESALMDGQCEQILFVPSHNALIATNGDKITVFDSRRLGAVVHETSIHTKAVTGMAYCPKHDVVLTASLDQRVKFISLKGEVSVVAAKKFDAPITAIGIHPEASEYAVGFASGRLSILKVFDKNDEEDAPDVLSMAAKQPASAAQIQEQQFKDKMAAIRSQLAKHQHQRAMRAALFSRMPDVIMSTLEELQRRCALRVALSGHNDRTMVQLLRFVSQQADNPSCSTTCLVTLDAIFEIYGIVAGKSPFFHRELMLAYARVGESVMAMQDIEASLGVMEMIRSA